MSRGFYYAVATVLLVPLLPLGLIKVVAYVKSEATPYCPLHHKFDGAQDCLVADRFGDKVLVNHFNAETNLEQLSIHEDGKTTWIQHPFGRIESVNPIILKNEIHFDPADSRSLRVNGEKFPIIELPGSP